MAAAVAAKSREAVKSSAEHGVRNATAVARVQGPLSRMFALGGPGNLIQRACGCGGAGATAEDETVHPAHAVQTVLRIGSSADPLELEADRAADQVTGTGGQTLSPPRISRMTAGGTAQGGAGAPPAVHEALGAAGSAIDAPTLTLMSARFGRDLGAVRVHTGPQAAESARQIDALAYTYRNHIVFGAGQYEPSSPRGMRLLAHELAHVVQQGSAQSFAVQRACGAAQVAQRPTTCTINPTPSATGTRFFFKTDCDDFSDGQESALDKFLATLAPSTTVNVLGLASSGAASFKENLSCARALKTATAVSVKGLTVGSVQGTSGIGAAGDTTAEAVDIQTRSGAPAPAPSPSPGGVAGAVTVTFPKVDAASTPSGGLSRIPPKVDTPITVQVNGTPAANAPISLSVMNSGGNNGSALIDGAAAKSITKTTTVKLRGATQTAKGAGNNLALLAKQSNSTIAQSNTFSVAAIPQNMSFSFREELTGSERGFRAFGKWESDSGTIADLDQAIVQEHVEVAAKTGGFASITRISTSGQIPANGAEVDKHSVPLSNCNQVGKLELKQTHTYNEARGGSTDVPITNSGFVILHEVTNKDPAFGGGLEVTTSKNGKATTANGVSSGAGSASIVHPQNV